MTFLVDQTNYLSQKELFPIPYSYAEKMILRNGIKFYTSLCPTIPYPVACRYFSHYKKLYWEGSHLLSQIQAGYIEREDIAFIVRFHKNISRGYIVANPNEQYCISFRKPKDEWHLDPVVYISLPK